MPRLPWSRATRGKVGGPVAAVVVVVLVVASAAGIAAARTQSPHLSPVADQPGSTSTSGSAPSGYTYPPRPAEPVPGHDVDQPRMPAHCLSSPHAIIMTAVAKCDLKPHIPGAPTIVMWGDSHAWQEVPAVRAAIAGRRVNLVGFMTGACPPMLIPHPSNTCDKLGRLALHYLQHARAQHRKVRLIVAMGWELYHDVLTHKSQVGEQYPPTRTEGTVESALASRLGVPRAFQRLGQMHVHTDVVGQMPMLYQDPPHCRLGRLPYRCALPRAGALRSWRANLHYIERMRRHLLPGGLLIQPSSYMCDATTCQGHVHGLPTYYDDFHIGARVSRSYGKQYFGPSVDALLAQH